MGVLRNDTMKANGKLTKRIIVTSTIAIVLVPVGMNLLPDEIARWYLAAAANSADAGNEQAVAINLKKAESWNASIKRDTNYWLVKFLEIPHDNPELQLSLLKDATQADSRFRQLGEAIA